MKTKTLCKLSKDGLSENQIIDYVEIVKKARFVCLKCGRVARKKKYLCKPFQFKIKENNPKPDDNQ